MELGVNIDHIAILREARKINDPDPLEAIYIAKRAGASQITIHLREDRRHIHDSDARRVVENSFLPVNIESAIDAEIVEIMCKLKPQRVTLVPEKRQEVTTEGGLDIAGQFAKVENAIRQLKDSDIEVSLFIDPDFQAVNQAREIGADMIELHTGGFANLDLMLHSNLRHTQHSLKEYESLSREELQQKIDQSLLVLQEQAEVAQGLGLRVAAGHGLNYQNVHHVAKIDSIFELNIGQSIIARSIFTGLENAIKEMVALIA